MIPLDEIRRARERLGDAVLHTPLVRFDGDVWLKLESLQPIGSFKLRGAFAWEVSNDDDANDLVNAMTR